MKYTNDFPENQFDLLRRAMKCTKGQLAERLGVNPRTLTRWEQEGAGATASARIAKLWGVILRESGTEWLEVSQIINFDNIKTIGGKR